MGLIGNIKGPPGAAGSEVFISQAYTGGLNPICVLCSPSLDRMYVPSNFSGEIRVYVSSTGALVSTISLSGVWCLFIINGELWATTISAGIIYRYNATTGAALGTISGSGSRGHAAYQFSSTKAFITNALSNNVTVINPSTNTVTATITGLGGTEPYGICLNNNPSSLHFGLLAVILRGSNLITLINPTTNAVVAVGVNPGSSLGNPSGIIYNATNDRYYISNADVTKQNIVMLSPSGATTFSVAGKIDGIAYADDLVQDTTTNRLYAGGHAAMTTLYANQFIYEIEMATNKVRKITPTGLWNNTTTLHNNLAIDETNGVLYTNVSGGATNLGANVTLKLKLRP
jgi:YVTN family beta-propeller protein